MSTDARTSLARLLQLASPALPVGAYSYSQGLESAIEARIVTDESSAERWIGACLDHAIAAYEAPLVPRLQGAWRAGDTGELARLNANFLASRESAELRAETVQMGYSLARLLDDLDIGDAATRAAIAEPSYPSMYACAAAAWGIAEHDALVAYLWGWLENQVMAAVKAVPLGQTVAQRILVSLGARIEPVACAALERKEHDWCNMMPRLAILSARHETQYSRLFRS